MIPEEEDDWVNDPEIQEFLEWADQPGPWPEEYDKIYTVGGLSADKDGDFMKFQKKIKDREDSIKSQNKKRDDKKGE